MLSHSALHESAAFRGRMKRLSRQSTRSATGPTGEAREKYGTVGRGEKKCRCSATVEWYTDWGHHYDENNILHGLAGLLTQINADY